MGGGGWQELVEGGLVAFHSTSYGSFEFVTYPLSPTRHTKSEMKRFVEHGYNILISTVVVRFHELDGKSFMINFMLVDTNDSTYLN